MLFVESQGGAPISCMAFFICWAENIPRILFLPTSSANDEPNMGFKRWTIQIEIEQQLWFILTLRKMMEPKKVSIEYTGL